MSERRCPCDGTNENCFRCGGLGYLKSEDSVSIGKPWPPPDWKPDPVTRGAGLCPACGQRVKSLQRHETRCNARRKKPLKPHPGRKLTKLRPPLSGVENPARPPIIRRGEITPPSLQPSPGLSGPKGGPWYCPDCGALLGNQMKEAIAYQRYLSHFSRLHKSKKTGVSPFGPSSTIRDSSLPCDCSVNQKGLDSIKPAATPTSHPPLVRCPICNASVLPARLDRHLRRVHSANLDQLAGRARPQPQTRAARHAQGPEAPRSGPAGQSLLQEDGDSGEAQSSVVERQLDGSRDFWQFRESGRFGSYSSFDDYEDESAP